MSAPAAGSQLKNFLLGGLLPIVAFTVVEAVYGAKAGLIAGIVLGLAEVIYEYITLGKVQRITIGSNALVVLLGGLALFENNPAFFKLQPAVVILVFAGVVIGSSILKKPLLVALLKKQRPDVPKAIVEHMRGLNLRMGICLIAVGLVGVHSAFYWSTAYWAAYKAVGAPVLMVVYAVLDVVIVRWIKIRASGKVLADHEKPNPHRRPEDP